MTDNEQTEQPLTFKLITKEVKTKHKSSDITEEFRSLSKSKALHDDKLIKEHFDIDADVSDSSGCETKKLTRGTKYKKDEGLVLLSDYESSPSYSSSEYIDSDEEYIETKTRKRRAATKKSAFPPKTSKKAKLDNSYKEELVDMDEDEDDFNMYTVEEIRKNKNFIFGAMNDFFQRRPNFIQPRRRAEIDTMKSSNLVSKSDNEAEEELISQQRNKTASTNSTSTGSNINSQEVYKYIDLNDGFGAEKMERRIEKQVMWTFSRAFQPEYFWFFYLKEHNYNFLNYLRQDLRPYLTETYIQKHNLDADLLTPHKTTGNNVYNNTDKKSELPESLVVVKMLSSALLLEEIKSNWKFLPDTVQL